MGKEKLAVKFNKDKAEQMVYNMYHELKNMRAEILSKLQVKYEMWYWNIYIRREDLVDENWEVFKEKHIRCISMLGSAFMEWKKINMDLLNNIEEVGSELRKLFQYQQQEQQKVQWYYNFCWVNTWNVFAIVSHKVWY